LMKDMDKARDIVKSVRQAMLEITPLSVKFRSGWDSANLNYLEFGQAMVEAGADILILHPRTVKQMFFGTSDWTHIAALKKAVFVPVVGNGDIRAKEDAQRMVAETDCDAVMIGRGVLGAPWLFVLIKRSDKNKAVIEINNKLRLLTATNHIK